MGPHRLGVTGRFAVFAVGDGGLGDEGAQPGVVGGVGEMQELLVGDTQLFPELS